MARKNRKPFFEHIEVVDAGAKGKAIAKAPDGKVIFVSNAVPGDIIDVQTFKKRRSYYEGKAVNFHRLSAKRSEPVCEHFGVCGGCKWQHMSYEHQLFYKQNEVLNNLQRIGQVDLPDATPILGAKEPYFYRNKMEFSFSDSRWLTSDEIASEKPLKDKNALGFHIPGMWDKILDLNQCHLQADPSNAIRLAVRQFAIDNNLEFFNTRNQTGFLRTLMIRTSSTKEIMVLIQFFKEDKKNRTLLLDFLKEQFPNISSLLYVINSKANDTIYDQEVICYAGNDHIFEEMDGLRFKINAKSFYQTNSDQAHELYKIVADFANLSGQEVVYDLYTGTGTIAQFIAQKAKKVIGVEAVADAVSAAKENATRNGIENCEFYVGDMAKIFDQQFIDRHGRPDLVITDPPRDGMHKKVVAELLHLEAAKIVYVSCNSATQARDLALLNEKYKVVRLQAVDMFPQTHHVENVVLLELR